MKRLFSSLMIFSCIGFYSLRGMEQLALAAGFKAFEEALKAEGDARKFLAMPENKKANTAKHIRSKISKNVRISRGYLEELLSDKDNIDFIKNAHKIFSNFLLEQEQFNYKKSSQYPKDQEILSKLTKKTEGTPLIISVKPFPSSFDLTQSTMCSLNTVRTWGENLQTLRRQQDELDQQIKAAETKKDTAAKHLQQKATQQKLTSAQLQAKEEQLLKRADQIKQQRIIIEKNTKSLEDMMAEFELVRTGDNV